jgi:aminopeptidase N
MQAMFLSVTRFELSYQLRNPVLWVSIALFFLLTFASVTIDQVQIGAAGNTNINAPYALIITVFTMGVLNLFAVVALLANSVLRDDETGFAPILRSTPLSRSTLILGRFSGAFLASALAFAAVPLAHLLGSLAPWLDPEELGAIRLADYLFAYAIVGVPQILIFGGLLFAIASVTRSMMGAYLGVVAILVAWTTSTALLNQPEHETLAALLDITGITALLEQTRYWTAADRNTRLPEISGAFLLNRTLWLSVALACLAATAIVSPRSTRRDRSRSTPRDTQTKALLDTAWVAPSPVFGRQTRWAQTLERTLFDLRYVLTSPAFAVLLMLGILNSAGALWLATESNGAENLPVTRIMVTALTGAFSIIPVLIAGYYAGDLVWRDREKKVHDLIDTTPTSDWSFILPKCLAVFLAVAAASLVGVFVSVLVQAMKGYARFELLNYLTWYVLPVTSLSALLAVLSITFQVLTPNKFMGWALLLLWMISNATFYSLGWEHNLYQYASTPPAPLSDFNGLGHFWIGQTWFNAYWGSAAVAMIILSWALWARGADRRLAPRLRGLGRRLSGPEGRWLAAASLAFLLTGAWIFYNTTILNTYESSPHAERTLAEAEKALSQFESMPGPTIRHVTLDVSIDPQKRSVETRGAYTITNQTGETLSRMIMLWPDLKEVVSVDIPGGRMDGEWSNFNAQMWTFDTPLASGETRTLTFETRISNPGFTNGAGQTRIVENGTFISNDRLSPYLGVSRALWLSDRAKRRKYGLEPERRPAKLEDPLASGKHYIRPDSDWVTADLTVTTDDDQIPIAPGYLVSEKRHEGRVTRHFQTEAPIHHFFSIQSARYAVRTAQADTSSGPVTLEIYYHPDHDRNIDAMERAMKVSLQMFSERFSPFQFRQMRILEFPAYASFAQAFANTVPFSEDLGWLQNNANPDSVDILTFVTAHEIAHQWWAHQIIGADRQGATLLSETLAQYSALLVMEEMFGPERVRRFLDLELNTYLSSRGSEVVEEVPLIRVENQPYIHYRKGAMVMYLLRNEIGERPINRAVQRLLERYAFKGAPYPSSLDFIKLLREEAPPEADALITDLFERITIYDLQVSKATSRRLADGSWKVDLTLKAEKYYADGEGQETPASLNEMVDIGLFTLSPADNKFSRSDVRILERRAIRSGVQTVELTAPPGPEPRFAGIDPYLKWIDRNGEDNLIPVTEGP